MRGSVVEHAGEASHDEDMVCVCPAVVILTWTDKIYPIANSVFTPELYVICVLVGCALMGVERAASPWPTLGIRSCRTFCSDLA